jgi:hypothetical protein
MLEPSVAMGPGIDLVTAIDVVLLPGLLAALVWTAWRLGRARLDEARRQGGHR